ncbi:MAG: hypothetical protein IPN47_15230 [Gemmatimonadetes bacterium]|nr:hypothetical protein [Gemmatimonadota bacterium]
MNLRQQTTPALRGPRARLANASSADEQTALVAERKAQRLGALIVAAASRLGRISDLSTVLMAAARRDKDAIAMAALADSPSPRNDNVK